MVKILLLALALRLPLLNQSLWLDEAIEALALQGHYGPLLSYALSDFQPPLYHFLLKAWTTVAGYSELALRTPSLLAGVVLVYFVTKIGEVLHSRRVGLVAGLLTATNPLLIYYSQEARPYIITTFFMAVCFYSLFSYLRRPRPLMLCGFALFLTLTLWTSYLAWVVPLVLALYFLFKKKSRLFTATLGATATLLLWAPSFVQSLSLGLGDAAASPEWGRVVGGTSLKALGLTWVKTAVGRISFTPSWLYITILVPLFFLHEHILRHVRRAPVVLWFWLAAIPLAALVSLFVPAYSYTRVLFVVPAYLILLALGLARFNNPAWLFSLVATHLLALVIFWFSPRFHREDWRFLTASINAGTGAVAMPSRNQLPPLIYYGLIRQVVEPAREPPPPDQVIYYIKYAEDIFDPGKLGQANLEHAGYTIKNEVSYIGIPLVIYENRP